MLYFGVGDGQLKIMAQIDAQGNLVEKRMLKFEDGLAASSLAGDEFRMGECPQLFLGAE